MHLLEKNGAISIFRKDNSKKPKRIVDIMKEI
jgi:hypothetical protein